MTLNSPELRQLLAISRVEKGLSIDQLAAASECRGIEIRGFENGLIDLSEEKIQKLVKALEISEQQIVATVGDELARRLV